MRYLMTGVFVAAVFALGLTKHTLAQEAPSPVSESLSRLSSDLGPPFTTFFGGIASPPLKLTDWPDVVKEISATCENCLTPAYRPKPNDIEKRLLLVPSDRAKQRNDIAYLSYQVGDQSVTIFHTARALGVIVPLEKPLAVRSQSAASATAIDLIPRIFTTLPSKPRWETKVAMVNAACIVNVEALGDTPDKRKTYHVLLQERMAVVIFQKPLRPLHIPEDRWFEMIKLMAEEYRQWTDCRVVIPNEYAMGYVDFWAGEVNQWREVDMRASKCPIKSVTVGKQGPPFEVEVVEKEKGQHYVIRVRTSEVTERKTVLQEFEILFENGRKDQLMLNLRTLPSRSREKKE